MNEPDGCHIEQLERSHVITVAQEKDRNWMVKLWKVRESHVNHGDNRTVIESSISLKWKQRPRGQLKSKISSPKGSALRINPSFSAVPMYQNLDMLTRTAKDPTSNQSTIPTGSPAGSDGPKPQIVK
ncbi:hypothetical protein M408DRAFT_317356 [Serendipita vermifera MAFF 305830]|uniref:Uncharacterized protein n=1 Tax=Serendipita vermifera MAFF 305830 TaxID=933852 RepID=A0A0C3AZB8_SERVB|nr:hypothetical protein M408DRAFT_317356 [Serendipita vermifera MAFF 305830]